MKPEKQEFLPRSRLNREEMEEMQTQIGMKAVFEDHIGFDPDRIEAKTVVGVDQAFLENKAVSAAVAIKNGKVIEKVHGVSSLQMPYIPGLLAFREAPSIIKALGKLSVEPDLLFFDGSGRIHFRQAGIAAHMGLLFDIPSIGVAKNLLCGTTSNQIEALHEGEKIPVYADSSINTEEGTLIGYAYQSKQYPNSKRINPLYISPGHKVSTDTSVNLTEKFCKGYKLPEPTKLADKYADDVKKRN